MILTVHDSHAYCDRGHSVGVITDGHHIYVTAEGYDLDDAVIERSGVYLNVPCPIRETDRYPACNSSVTVNLSFEDWRAATPADWTLLASAPRITNI